MLTFQFHILWFQFLSISKKPTFWEGDSSKFTLGSLRPHANLGWLRQVDKSTHNTSPHSHHSPSPFHSHHSPSPSHSHLHSPLHPPTPISTPPLPPLQLHPPPPPQLPPHAHPHLKLHPHPPTHPPLQRHPHPPTHPPTRPTCESHFLPTDCTPVPLGRLLLQLQRGGQGARHLSDSCCFIL